MDPKVPNCSRPCGAATDPSSPLSPSPSPSSTIAGVSSDAVVASSSEGEREKVCAACTHLRLKCEPGCVFAPYFGSEDGERFAVLEGAFGASNVSKVVVEHEPGERAVAIKRLLYLATERVWGSSVPRGHAEKLPIQRARQLTAAQQAAATAQASREQALMMQYHAGTGFGVPAAHLPSYHYQAMIARHHDMMMRQAAAAQNYQAFGLEQQRQGAAAKRKSMPQPVAELQQRRAAANEVLMMQYHAGKEFGVPAGRLPSHQATEIERQQTAAAAVARHRDMKMRQAAVAMVYQALGLQRPRQNQQLAEDVTHQNRHTALTAEAAKRSTAADAAMVREIDKILQFLRQAAVEEQYMNRCLSIMMQQTVVDGQQEHHHLGQDRAGKNAVIRRNIMKGIANRQYIDQNIKRVQQYWEKELMMMMEKAAANAPAMPGEQPQPQRQTGNH